MTNTVSAEYLRSYVERIERLEEERKALAEDVREVYAEAAGNGFDKKALRELIKLRSKDASEIEEQEYLLHTYMIALGMKPELNE